MFIPKSSLFFIYFIHLDCMYLKPSGRRVKIKSFLICFTGIRQYDTDSTKVVINDDHELENHPHASSLNFMRTVTAFVIRI